MAAPEVNYDDKRFGQVETDKQQALTELENTYGGMIGEADQYYQKQIDAANEWAEKQGQLQQEKSDFAIEQIEQQKEQAQKDYTKEQSGAYVDWRKQSNEYGTEAEKMASSGLAGTGFSESSQVGMYNAYQNRVSMARESYNRAVLNYNNAIKEARLQNNSVLAEIAYQALQSQLELSLQGFQYKNNLILDQANKKMELDNAYYQRYQNVLQQINTENAFAEEQRQFDLSYEQQAKAFNESIRQFNQNYEENVRQFNVEIERLRKKDAQEYQLEIQNLELKKQQLAEEKRRYEAEMALKQQQLAESKRQFDAEMAAKTGSGTINKGKDGGTGGINKEKDEDTGKVKNEGKKNEKLTMDSIMKLGYGPISEQELNDLVAKGYVEEYYENGVLLFRNKQKNFGGGTTRYAMTR